MRVAIAALAALAAGLSPALAGDLSAHGDATEIFRGTEGAYELVLAVQPEETVVGTIHITITPFDAATSMLVDSAEIVIVAHDPEGAPTYQARAINTPASPEYYDANITFESDGEWTLMVSVDHATLGKATFSVPLGVGELPVPAGSGGAVVWLFVLVVLAGGATYVWRTSRRRTADRQAT